MMKDQQNRSRQVLRPWLEGILNRGDIPEVKWIDKTMMKFRIPWPRGGDNGDKDRQKIYMNYAINTGKYRAGIDEEDYKKWKSRLRCALNKAKDIIHLKEESKLDDLHPFQVYMFKGGRNVQEASIQDSYVQGAVNFIVQENGLDKESNLDERNCSLPADLESIDTDNLVAMDDDVIKFLSDKMDSMQLDNSVVPTGFEMYVKVDYLDALHFQEKLPDTCCGFFVGSSSIDMGEAQCLIQEVIIKEMEEFNPGILLFHNANNIYCSNHMQASLFFTNNSTSEEIRPLETKLLLSNQDQPSEINREVVISKTRGSFCITVGTAPKLNSNNGAKNADLVEQFNLEKSDDFDGMKNEVTFDNLLSSD